MLTENCLSAPVSFLQFSIPFIPVASPRLQAARRACRGERGERSLQVEHAPRRPRGESKGRGRRGPGRGAPREQSQDAVSLR